MIAVDTSSWIAYFQDESGMDVVLVDQALADRQVLASSRAHRAPKRSEATHARPFLVTCISAARSDGRLLGACRLSGAKLVAAKRKAPLADTLIAQTCLDHDARLIARDSGYRHFSKIAGLKLLS